VGEIAKHKPVLLIAAVTSRYLAALDWTIEETSEAWGDVALRSPVFDFTETSFYTESMGTDLKKQFIAFDRLLDPCDLPATKHQSNQWEEDYSKHAEKDEVRPLNIDPGYISEAKLVLATTKDRDHRIYLSGGIFRRSPCTFGQNNGQVVAGPIPIISGKIFRNFSLSVEIYSVNE